jgi:membrane fusion protein, multidrug efflux system
MDPLNSSPSSKLIPQNKTKRNIFILVLVAVLLVAVFWTWNPFDRKSESANKNDPSGQSKRADGATSEQSNKDSGSSPSANKGRGGPPTVALDSAKVKDFEVWVDSLGTVTPLANVTIHTRVDGELLKIHYREGQTVKAGDLIAEIDPRAYQVQLDQAIAAAARDKALLDNAKVDLRRYQDLVQHEAIPKQQLDTQVSLVNQNEATLKTDQSAIDSARLQLSYCRIQSPISGQVGLRLVDPGNIVHAGDVGGIVSIAQMNPISVLFSIPQDFLPALNRKRSGGKPITVEAFDRSGNVSLQKGTLSSLDNQIDPSTGSVKLRGSFSNKEMKLYPNQFVNIRVLMEVKPSAIVIPNSALQRGAKGPFVYVVSEDKKVSLRPIEIGPSDRNEAVVTKGLADGEKVVIDGADKLKDGVMVNLADIPSGRKKAEH